jgi:ATP-dependent Clp protease protease subunit
MKYTYASVAVLALLTITTFTWSKTSKSATPKNDVVNVTNNTLTGNITNELKVSNNDLVSNSKSIIKRSIDNKRVVYLNTEVEYQSSQALVQQLKDLEAQSSDPIYMLIDSPGGSVVDGAAVISQIEVSTAPVYTVCTRLCASMAAMIHSYGAKRYSLDRAILMYHPAAAGAQGQLKNALSLLKTLDRYANKMISNIVKRSRIDRTEFEALVAYELWIDSEDALQRGLIDGIISLNVSPGESNLGKAQDDARRKLSPLPNKAGAFHFDMKSNVEFAK